MKDLPEHIKALLDARSRPSDPGDASLGQTHVSYLVFTPDFVYKIKKPVDFGFLDFTTLEKRRFYCEEELRLNRRLAPRVYLGVEAITRGAKGFRLGGDGEAVDYAVVMRRLDEKNCLRQMLDAGTVTEELIGRLAVSIAEFHNKAETNGRIREFGSLDILKKNTLENFSQTERFTGKAISNGLFKRIRDYTGSFLEANRELFSRRVEEGFIRDCHGDIHSEHVFADGGIEIIDCIEFNERFRFSDVVADIAFLSMDLDFRNRKDLSAFFDREYFAATRDEEGKRLLNFYKCYRAYVRGKVEAFKASEEEVEEAARREAQLSSIYHFHLSGRYASGGASPMLIMVCGLPGTGKTTLAREIARRTGFVHVMSDVVRKELAGKKPEETGSGKFGEGIYSESFTERTYSEIAGRAGSFLGQGRSCVVDATFSKKKYLDRVREAAAPAGALVFVVECAAPDEVIKARLDKRCLEAGNVSDADWRIYLWKKASFEEIPGPRVAAGAEKPLEENLLEVFRAVFD